MKKLDGFDYRKAEADLDNVGDCHPDEIYSYHSEKAVRGYMKEHGLNPDKYYNPDRKNTDTARMIMTIATSLLHALLREDCRTPVPSYRRFEPSAMVFWPAGPMDRRTSKNTIGWLPALWHQSISGKMLSKSGTACMQS